MYFLLEKVDFPLPAMFSCLKPAGRPTGRDESTSSLGRGWFGAAQTIGISNLENEHLTNHLEMYLLLKMGDL